MLHRFLVTIPAGVEAGMTFAVVVNPGECHPVAVVANPVATAEAVEAED